MAEWAIFSLAIICILIFMYSISILLLRSFDVSWLASIAISPILSVTFYSTLAIIYSFLSINTNLFTLFVPFLIISILFLIIKKPTLRSIFSLKEESTVLKYLHLIWTRSFYCTILNSNGKPFFFRPKL